VAKATGKTQQNFLTRVTDPVVRYLRDTRAELRKVTWPTREEAWKLTLIVLGTVVVMSIILGLADLIFAEIMRGLIVGDPLWIAVGVVAIILGAAAMYYFSRD
jgi:preprotein translocase subunit SecE